jgi:hypothetical protein
MFENYKGYSVEIFLSELKKKQHKIRFQQNIKNSIQKIVKFNNIL